MESADTNSAEKQIDTYIEDNYYISEIIYLPPTINRTGDYFGTRIVINISKYDGEYIKGSEE